MALSIPFDKSIQMQYLEHDGPSEDKNSGCVLADLMSRSLSMYVELEKTHWHLRLNPARHTVNFESARPSEVAREVCAISLRLIASISRLQRVLNPDFSPECAALFAAVQEKVAEICELQSERQFDHSEQIATLVQGPSSVERAFRDTRPFENAETSEA